MRLHREESNNGIMTKSQYSFMEKSQQSYVASETRWGKVVIDESTFLRQVEFMDISALHGIDTLKLGGAGVQEDEDMENEESEERARLERRLKPLMQELENCRKMMPQDYIPVSLPEQWQCVCTSVQARIMSEMSGEVYRLREVNQTLVKELKRRASQ